MPSYEYECTHCGGFSAVKPMAQYQEPHPCPGCGQLSARAHLSAPAFGGMSASNRQAHAINEQAAHQPKSSQGHVHGAGCGCGSKSIGKSKTVTAPDGKKAFPAKRPWMISH